MAKMTPEEVNIAIDEMVDAGINEREIESFLEGQGVMPAPSVMDLPTGEQGLRGTQTAARFIGPFALGALGSGAGARIATSPRVARAVESIARPVVRRIAQAGVRAAQPVGEFAGQVAGDIAGRAVAGEPQDIKESAVTSGIGTGIGGLFRVATRGIGGYIGGVPQFAIEEAGVPTAGVIPSVQKIMRPTPSTSGQVFAGISAEGRLADRARAATKKLMAKLTPERQQKVAILKQSDRAGVRIDVDPILQKIIDETPQFRAEPSTIEFAEHLDKFADGLISETAKRGGSLTPSQLDEFIRTNLAPKSFTAAGAPSQTRVGPVIREIKTLSTELLNKHLPSKVRDLNTKISARLSQAEDAAALFSEEKAGIVNRLRNLYKAGNEENVQALEFLANETDKSLAREARKIATQRAFTTDPRDVAGSVGRFGATIAKPFEAVGQAMAPFQAFVGPAAGGVIASRNREKEKARKRAIKARANP